MPWLYDGVCMILMGYEIDEAVSRDAMQNPAAIHYFIDFAMAQADYRIDL